MKAGLNLFSINSLIKTEEEFLQTAIKLKEMGYSYMQFSGAPYDPDKIKRVSDASGMPVCLTHVPYNRIVNETEALMEEHAKFNCKNIGLGVMPFNSILDEKLCLETIDDLEKAAQKMKANGFNFFYHHHHFEFTKHNGETVFDYMIKNAKNINFTADTYWLQYGGVKIEEYLEKLSGRIECIHLKDYSIRSFIKEDTGKVKFEPKFAPVGDGTIDFKSAVNAAKKSGAKYFLVEQDNACDFDDPLGQVERSIKYITNEL
jgi:sugar phosphate isomerase/epimerase